MQETFTPVYYLVLIIVMKMVIPNPTYPAITTPQGSSSVMNFPKLSSNSTQIGIAPNDEKTQTFINEIVLKSSILYVSYAFWNKLLSNANLTGKLRKKWYCGSRLWFTCWRAQPIWENLGRIGKQIPKSSYNFFSFNFPVLTSFISTVGVRFLIHWWVLRSKIFG